MWDPLVSLTPLPFLSLSLRSSQSRRYSGAMFAPALSPAMKMLAVLPCFTSHGSGPPDVKQLATVQPSAAQLSS